MVRKKAKATIMAADGAGGMTQVIDRRFEAGPWPISFDVPEHEANTWLQYFSAECGKRGWSCQSIGQLDARENSGSITVTGDASEAPQLAVIWERKRGGPLKIRARSAGMPEFPLDQARDLIDVVHANCQAGAKDLFHRQWHLSYEGLPWRGELWLDQSLRLSAPSKYDETALVGPRIILVDWQRGAIDWADANAAFGVERRELSVFLSVVLRRAIRVSPNGGRGWTWTADATGQVECSIRNLGYWETEWPAEIPTPGQMQPVPLRSVQRPDFSRGGIAGSQTELHVPADMVDLWQAFTQLPPDRRRQFLQVGSMWQLAASLGHEYQTAAFTIMVAACEVLKPLDPVYKDHNIGDVVEALLGKASADLLKEPWFQAQRVRSDYLHKGELRGSEFVQHAMLSSFRDPSFDQAWTELWKITPAAIIEWLRRGGTFSMPARERRSSWRRWVKERGIVLLPICAAAGIFLGWVLRAL